jgi:hypothetical protein
MKKIINEEVFDIETEFNYKLISSIKEEELNALISINKKKDVNIKNCTDYFLLNVLSDQLLKNKKIGLFIENVRKDKLKLKLLEIFKQKKSKNIVNKEFVTDLKNEINQYTELLGSYPLNSEKTNQEILENYVFFKETVVGFENIYIPDLFLEFRDINNKSQEIFNIINDLSKSKDEIEKKIKINKIQEHLWYGCQRFYSPIEKNIILEKLKTVDSKAEDLLNFVIKIQEDFKIVNKKKIEEISNNFDLLTRLYNYSQSERVLLININRSNKNNIERLTKKIEKNTKKINEIKNNFNINVLKKEIINLNNIQGFIKENNFTDFNLKELNKLNDLWISVNKSFNYLNNSNNVLNIKINQESDYLLLLNIIEGITDIEDYSILKNKNKNYLKESFYEKLELLEKEKLRLKDKYFKIEQKISLKSLLSLNDEELNHYINDFKKYNIFNYFTKKKKSFNFIINLWKETMITNKKYIIKTLEEVLKYREEEKIFKKNSEFVIFFGDTFKGVDTNLNDIRNIKKWFTNIEILIKNENNIKYENIINIKFDKIEYLNKNKINIITLKDILINLFEDKSRKIYNYDIKFKKKIINNIYHNNGIIKTIENNEKNYKNYNILNEIMKEERLNLSDAVINIGCFKDIIEIEKEIKLNEEVYIFKNINLFKDNLTEYNFIFNKVFQTINNNSLFFIGYKNQINNILRNNKKEEMEDIKNTLMLKIEEYKNNYDAIINYLSPEENSFILNYDDNIETEKDKIQKLIKNIDLYTDYSKYFDIKNILYKYKLNEIIIMYENNKLSKIELENIIRLNMYKSLSKEVLNTEELKYFNSEDYENKVKDFKKTIIQLNNNNIEYLSNKIDVENVFNNQDVDFDLIITDDKDINVNTKNVLSLNEEISNKFEYHKFIKKEELNEVKNTQWIDLINNKLSSDMLQCKSIKSEYFDAIVKNIKTGENVSLLRIDNKKYYEKKYAREREIYINELSDLKIIQLWTCNFISNFENEILKIKKDIK